MVFLGYLWSDLKLEKGRCCTLVHKRMEKGTKCYTCTVLLVVYVHYMKNTPANTYVNLRETMSLHHGPNDSVTK